MLINHQLRVISLVLFTKAGNPVNKCHSQILSVFSVVGPRPDDFDVGDGGCHHGLADVLDDGQPVKAEHLRHVGDIENKGVVGSKDLRIVPVQLGKGVPVTSSKCAKSFQVTVNGCLHPPTLSIDNCH